MHKERTVGVYVVWNIFQRRAETLSRLLSADLVYYHFQWEEKSRAAKAASYVGKFIRTLVDLIRARPDYIVLQLAPVPLLYVAAIYCLWTRCAYICDCHNTMIYDSHWINWPGAKGLLRRSSAVIVHNDDVKQRALELGIRPIVIRDPLPVILVEDDCKLFERLDLQPKEYVIVPGSLAADEPIAELFQAMELVPETFFVLTWFVDRLPSSLRDQVPENAKFTGYLPEREFNLLYARAAAALVLTTREGTQPSGASEAIALNVPLIISRIQTTARLYGEGAILVDNEKNAIAAGVREAMRNRDRWVEQISRQRDTIQAEAALQVGQLRRLIHSP